VAQSHGSWLSRIKARATGFGKPCRKPGLAWLFTASFGWLKPPGQSQHITIYSSTDSIMEVLQCHLKIILIIWVIATLMVTMCRHCMQLTCDTMIYMQRDELVTSRILCGVIKTPICRPRHIRDDWVTSYSNFYLSTACVFSFKIADICSLDALDNILQISCGTSELLLRNFIVTTDWS
jgi:hypothetical protein